MAISNVSTNAIGDDSVANNLSSATESAANAVGGLNDPAMNRENMQINNASAEWINSIGSDNYSNYTGSISGIDLGGMATDDLDTFITALNQYRDGVQEDISIFNPQADLDEAIKGEANAAYHQFLEAAKTLMVAYVNTLNAEIKDIQAAAEEIKSTHRQLGTTIESDADSLRSAADSINVN